MFNVLKNMWRRIDWHIVPITILFAFLLMAIYPTMLYAPAEWFVEDGAVENVQLIVLIAAMIIALCAKYEKKMFVLVAFVALLLLVREVNGGRAYFCKLYLEPDEICSWKNMKYGYLADWVRWGVGLSVVVYALMAKLWRPIWKYVTKAPIYVWDFVLLIIVVVGAQAAELQCVDNEILEEGMETVMYMLLAWLIWRYGRVKIN